VIEAVTPSSGPLEILGEGEEVEFEGEFDEDTVSSEGTVDEQMFGSKEGFVDGPRQEAESIGSENSMSIGSANSIDDFIELTEPAELKNDGKESKLTFSHEWRSATLVVDDRVGSNISRESIEVDSASESEPDKSFGSSNSS
jgi:hypothetical protein